MPFPQVRILGMSFANVDRWRLLDHVFACLARGEGGWLVTANLDFLRRYTRDRATRALYDRADLTVADGMPIVWAAWLQGDPLLERVAGSSLVPLIADRAAREGRSLFLLGGEPASNERAAAILCEQYPRLVIAGRTSPRVSNPPTEAEADRLRRELGDAKPDIVLVALGSPKQELLIPMLRPAVPSAWMAGVGISLSFIAGHVRRAPPWMQQIGLEWAHRLAQEPRRLARRYLIHDLPFALYLLAAAAAQRRGGGADE